MNNCLPALLIAFLFLFRFSANAFDNEKIPGDSSAHFQAELPFYTYSTDLSKLKKDRLFIRIDLLTTGKNEVTFCMPKVIPGIYGSLDFGKLVSKIKATDFKGKSLKVTRMDDNRWKISKAENLASITYYVKEGWNTFGDPKEGGYLSASSSFEKEKAFVINHNALFGYLEGYDNRPVGLKITKPAALYGATSLEKTTSTANVDYYYADNYHRLTDNPILYAVPDTAQFRLGNDLITVASYSSTGTRFSKDILSYIRPLIENQKAYLGGELPVSNYTFLLYHNENPDQHSVMGDGLEHSNSTLILLYMPSDVEMIRWSMYKMASHEFFHTLIPLGLQSEEIANYDYNNPKLSQHLWMYEGLTEYFTMHMPIKQKAISMDDFLRSTEEKMAQMRNYSNEHSLTYLSAHAIDFQQDYMNFYQKGALVNLCLDIELRELSEGTYGVQDLIKDLMQFYGPHPFRDSELFDKMTSVSGQPAIRAFFTKYVEGTEVLPVSDYLLKSGIATSEDGKLKLLDSPTEQQLQLRNWWIGQ